MVSLLWFGLCFLLIGFWRLKRRERTRPVLGGRHAPSLSLSLSLSEKSLNLGSNLILGGVLNSVSPSTMVVFFSPLSVSFGQNNPINTRCRDCLWTFPSHPPKIKNHFVFSLFVTEHLLD
ncbi:hypothetical protein BDE02_05G134500 [Populus trichocarpa]|nr:hypothetical protein BDE02_05G134500 [Populus trichocarpa]